MAVFLLAFLLLALLSLTGGLGFRTNSTVAQVALWFALGTLAVPILLLLIGCLASFGSGW